MIRETAPAKINLFLHITGKRADGYHLLDSLAVFAHPDSAACDEVRLQPAPSYALSVSGPFAAGLEGEDPEKNLITKALRLLAQETGRALDFRIELEKNLPVASGIGGGSSDAAAALRAAARHFGFAADHPALSTAARGLGADGLVCYQRRACMMRGIGDDITPVAPLPPAALLLVNPNVPLPTAAVYAARQGAFTPPATLPSSWPQTGPALADWLKTCRNDLQPPAQQLCPAIATVLAALERQEGCLLARLSGSGATCFALFSEAGQAEAAARALSAAEKDWWVAVSSFAPS